LAGRRGGSNRTRSPGRGGDDSDDDSEAYFETLDEDESEEAEASARVLSSQPVDIETDKQIATGDSDLGDNGADSTHVSRNGGAVQNLPPAQEEAHLRSGEGLQGILGNYADDDDKDEEATEEVGGAISEGTNAASPSEDMAAAAGVSQSGSAPGSPTSGTTPLVAAETAATGGDSGDSNPTLVIPMPPKRLKRSPAEEEAPGVTQAL